MRRIAVCSALLLLCASVVNANQASLSLRSPDGKIEVSVVAKGMPTYAVSVDGQMIVRPSKLGLQLRDGANLGKDVELLKAEPRSANSTWENPWGKRRQVRDEYNELRIVLGEKSSPPRTFEVIFRAYNDGMGFRYVLPAQSGVETFILEREQTEFAFAGDYACFAGRHEKEGFQGSQEWEFKPGHIADIKLASIIGLPLLIQTPAAWVALTEADLRDWAGMWLGGAVDGNMPGGATLIAKLEIGRAHV